MRPLLLSLAILVAATLQATTYYVSPSGNDGANGTSTGSAWKTITRVNQATYGFQPGDRVLFQRGGTWRGELIMGSSGSAALPITVGAYGTGADPVIKGSVLVSGWTQHQGNIWKASVLEGRVDQVYVNGQRQVPARFPNTGWLHNDQCNGWQIQSNDLTQGNGYWNGAKVVFRTTPHSFDTLRVSTYSNGNLNLTTQTLNLGNHPWGFYLVGKLSELDSPGEWYYDPVAKKLYLWAPGGGNPGNLQVEASVYNNGVNCYWQRAYIVVEDMAFRHQRLAGVLNDGANHVTVQRCDLRQLYHGIRSSGPNDTYDGNTFQGTYATGILAIQGNTTITGNVLTGIAKLDGEGESTWGYFGIRSLGLGNVIRGNRLDTIGYIGISAEKNALVERNVVLHTLATLNDGGGIAIDHVDGMVIQDNIVGDVLGTITNGSPDYLPYNEQISIGIYFGNTDVQNTSVLRNTVYNCPQSGIHVDHTMVTSGVKVKDNICFNNGSQLTLSDYSNNTGTGAVPPYYVANYNDVYSGNQFYCLTADQVCMKQMNVYGSNPVDFGTFTNNRYFNPYNELSIRVINLFAGWTKNYTLERWQSSYSEDAGSTRSPMRFPSYGTVQELSQNLVVNGEFTSNVNGWDGWPDNAQVTRVTDRLDNGCLKANLPNASQYPSFSMRNPDQFAMQNQAWYRLKFSIQSDVLGDLLAGVKGQSQIMGGNVIWQLQVPFSPERRDLELYFQGTLTDQAMMQFTNQWTEPQYYLDNVDLRKVTASPKDPLLRNKLFVNDQATPQSFSVPSGCWKDMDGNFLSTSITVPAYSSKLAYLYEGPGCNGGGGGEGVRVKVVLGGAYDAGTGLMRDELRAQAMLPDAEPSSALGSTVENAGATVAAAVKNVTGSTAVVDWVLLELRNGASSTQVTARRAALVRRDGTVVDPAGNDLVAFTGQVAGKYLSVRHRNHLGVLCTTALTNGGLVDLTQPSTALYGTGAAWNVGGNLMLWPGKVNADAKVKYSGTNNDCDEILAIVGQPTGMATGYVGADVNLDGSASFTGPANDRDAILVTVGGSQPTATRTEQLP